MVDGRARRDIASMNTTKRLTRSSTDKYVAGVSGGLGEHFGVDPTMVRVGWVFATLISGGAALLAYAALMVVVPREEDANAEDRLPGVPA
jgi:phage shock protein C